MVWPILSHGIAHVARKGEDFHSFHDLVWKVEELVDVNDPGVTFKAYGVYDGHGGIHSADFVRSNLINEFVKCLSELAVVECRSNYKHAEAKRLSSRQLWDRLHVQAIKLAFVHADEHCRQSFERSGTTATVVLVVQETEDRSFVSRFAGDARRVFCTVANVGDSSVYLDTGANVLRLNEEHRAGTNRSETKRVEDSGGLIKRDDSKSPYRLYPGGLMMTRTIGDRDAHQAIGEPSVTEVALRVELKAGGGRIIMASDGLWDSVTPKESANLIRKTKATGTCAKSLVREASKREGRMGDDVTVIIVDISDAPNVPFASVVPADNVPNKPVVTWKPLIGENPPEFIRMLQNAEPDPLATWFHESEPVIFESDATKKEYRVSICEGPMCYLQGRGWVFSAQLRSALAKVAPPQLTYEELKEFAVEEEAYGEQPLPSQSPPWEESQATKKKKQAAMKRTEKKVDENKTEEKEASSSSLEEAKGAKKKRSRPRRERKNQPLDAATSEDQKVDEASGNSATTSEESPDQVLETKQQQLSEEKASEFHHQLFVVGFPDDWEEADARDYFSRFGELSSMLFKENSETHERAIFLSYADRSSDRLEDLCGKYIINTAHMFVVKTEDAFEDVLASS